MAWTDYLQAHPGWAFLFLVVILGGVQEIGTAARK